MPESADGSVYLLALRPLLSLDLRPARPQQGQDIRLRALETVAAAAALDPGNRAASFSQFACGYGPLACVRSRYGVPVSSISTKLKSSGVISTVTLIFCGTEVPVAFIADRCACSVSR
jgi:hypothetical protein